jgi:ribosomal protein S18 acetylase RimI-like enzyme
MLKVIEAHAPEDLDRIRELFREYSKGLGIDLCFQNFEEELSTLPGKYTPPHGRLFLALDGNDAIGCVALRPLEGNVCEMKRLYVRPSARRGGLGRLLANKAILTAREIGYEQMRLDTLASMNEAIGLYRSLGFVDTGPYSHNPSPCAIFMQLHLRPVQTLQTT